MYSIDSLKRQQLLCIPDDHVMDIYSQSVKFLKRIYGFCNFCFEVRVSEVSEKRTGILAAYVSGTMKGKQKLSQRSGPR